MHRSSKILIALASDITAILADVATLLDAAMTGVDMPARPALVTDRSKIDFEALARRFKASKHKNSGLEVLKATIWAMLEQVIRLNKTGADFGRQGVGSGFR